MVKLIAPLHSLDAHGTIGDALTFSSRKSGAQCRFQKKQKMTVPAYAQIDNQSLYRVAYARWLAFTDTQKEEYRDLATQSGQAISGWNYFLGNAIANPKTYLGLVGYWTFNKDQSGTATDVSKNGNTGTLKPSWPGNVPAYVDSKNAKMERALSFDGVDDYVDCGNDSSLNITNAFTVEAWVKVSDTSNVEQIVAKAKDATGQRAFRLFRQSNNVYFDTWTSARAWSTTTITSNTWYHLAGTYDGVNQELYIDGVSKDTDPQSGDITVVSHNLYIGIELNSSGNPIEFFNGTIDEVCIYNRALSATEIKTLYNLFR